MPYLPVPVRLKFSSDKEIRLQWSYVVPFDDPDRGFFDYWGHDLPDLEFLWNALKPGMNFFDIGAYHGIYTLVAAKRLAGKGQIIAFEPSPRERRRLKMHLRSNGMRFVRVESYAVGSRPSDDTFYNVVEGDTSRNGLRPPSSTDPVKKLKVKTISLDEYLSKFPLQRLDVVKLDVEGAELEVLRGARSVLTKLRPMFICEVFDATTSAWGYDAKEIVSTLKQYEYEWFEFNAGGKVMPHEVKDRYPEVRNFLAVPRERSVF